MNKRLLILKIFLLLSLNAVADSNSEKTENRVSFLEKDIYFQAGGGARLRYQNLENTTDGTLGKKYHSEVRQRFQTDMKVYKGEYFETFLRLLHVSEWGDSYPKQPLLRGQDLPRDSGIQVNQAWALWKIDDVMGLQMGRAPVQLGRGFTYSPNDWFDHPYSFDQIRFTMDWPTLDLSFIAFQTQSQGTEFFQEESSTGPQENHLILDLDLAQNTTSFEVFNLHFIQFHRSMGNSTEPLDHMNQINAQRFVLDAVFKGRRYEATTFVTYVLGEKKFNEANRMRLNLEGKNIQQLAIDLTASVGFPEWSSLTLRGGYHYDSGGGPGDSMEDYDSLYYKVFGQAGRMDFLRWGNLSYYHLGLELDLTPKIHLGSQWLSFSKTNSSGGVHFGHSGHWLSSQIQGDKPLLGEGTDLGQELDLWVDYGALSGVQIRLMGSAFLPGGVLTQVQGVSASTNFTSNMNKPIYLILTQIGFFF